jgi:hypothetical protein
VSIDRYGRFHPRTGSATLRGTISCEGRADYTSVEVSARQRVGRQYVNGYGYLDDIACDGSTQPWSVEVSPDDGLFKGGKALAVSWAYACGPFECGDGFVEQTVQLRGRRS